MHRKDERLARVKAIPSRNNVGRCEKATSREALAGRIDLSIRETERLERVQGFLAGTA